MNYFKVPTEPKTTQKNIRFPNELIEQIEVSIRGTNCSFSNFVINATRFAINNMKK